MSAAEPIPLSIPEALASLTFLPDRTPTTTDAEAGEAFSRLAPYRDGGIFVGHWAGTSEWERHGAGDEIVMVLQGSTRITFHTDEGDRVTNLGPGDLVVVPQGTWHRFDTPGSVALLSVTPQPTDHRADPPV